MQYINIVLGRFRQKGGGHNRGFLELFVADRLIQGLAVAMLSLFVPIFLYETTGQSLSTIALFYAAVGAGYVLLLPMAMKITNYIGFSLALTVGAVFAVAQYAFLYVMTPENVWQYLLPLALALIGYRLWHWVPYHVDFTEFTKGGSRGRDVSLVFATVAFMGVIGPILAGFIIANAGYQTLFLVGTVLLLCAAVSYLFVPANHQHFSWSFTETFSHLFSKEFKPVLIGDMANGAETVVTLVAWPIFLFVILDGNVLEIGALSTVIVGLTIVVQLFVGRYLDAHKGSNQETLRVGSALYAVGWVIKIFVLSATQIFFIGLYHNITRIFIKTPYSAILYDMSGEQGEYVDEFTVLREMAHHSGRALALLLMVLLTFYFSIEWTFLIAAVASLLVNAVYAATQSD